MTWDRGTPWLGFLALATLAAGCLASAAEPASPQESVPLRSAPPASGASCATVRIVQERTGYRSTESVVEACLPAATCLRLAEAGDVRQPTAGWRTWDADSGAIASADCILLRLPMTIILWDPEGEHGRIVVPGRDEAAREAVRIPDLEGNATPFPAVRFDLPTGTVPQDAVPIVVQTGERARAQELGWVVHAPSDARFDLDVGGGRAVSCRTSADGTHCLGT